MDKGYNLYNLEPQFREFLIAENISPISLKNYLSDIRYFLGWMSQKSLKVETIDKKIVEDYRQYLVDNKHPHKSINRRLSTLRKFCSFCISQGWTKENPAKKIGNIANIPFAVSPTIQEEKASESPNLFTKVIDKVKSRMHKKDGLDDMVDGQHDIKPTNQNSAGFNFGLNHYIGFLIVLVFVAILGAGIYNQFFSKTSQTFAYPTTLQRAGRILSFQGRLTDSLGNPITTATNVTFSLYNVSTGGTPIYTSGACSLTPDPDGIINVLVGGSGYSPTPPTSTYNAVCGAELDATIFTQNPNVYMGVTVASDAEMTPRQQIANVGYALNAETLQGFPPGTGASNIPFIDYQGDLLIATASPDIASTWASATFTISSANSTVIQSAGSGDITLQATESGAINFRTGGTTDSETRLYIDTASNGGNIGIGTTTPSSKLTIKGTSSEATYGANLLTNGNFSTGDFTGWTAGANWSVVSNAAQHTTGSTATLSQNISVTNGTKYQIEWSDTGNTGYIGLSIGAVSSRIYGTWETSGRSTTIVASGTGTQTFTITPSSDYNGSLDNVTVRAIFTTPSSVIKVENSDGTTGMEIRAGGTGLYNTGVGASALYSNTSGSFNAAFGGNSLLNNTTGYNNTGLGVNTLYSNTTGASNIGIGTAALFTNTSGSANSALGEASLYYNTTGTSNTAIGQYSLVGNTTGFYNVGLGNLSLAVNSTGYNNTAIGPLSLYDVADGINNTAIGYGTGRGITTGDNNTIIGANVTGLSSNLQNNVIIADGSGNQRINVDSSGNVGIGDTTPDHFLDVAGNIGLNAGGFINFGDTDGVSGYGFRDNGGNIEFKNSSGSWTGIGSGGGSSVWSDLLDPTDNLSLSMGAYTTGFNWATGTGSNNLFSLTTDASSNGTGYLLNLATGASSTVKPLNITAGGVQSLNVDSTGNVGIGDTTPSSLFTVGNGDLFTIDSTGRITKIDNVAHTIDDVSGNLTLTSNSNQITLNDNTSIAGTLSLPNSNTMTGVASYIQFNNGISVGGGTTYRFTSTGDIYGNNIYTGGTQRINSGGNLVNIGSTQFNGVTYTWPGGDGVNGSVLRTNGAGGLSWYDLSGDPDLGPWTIANGAIYPDNSTLDLFIGGSASDSAKFAFLNVNSGDPTASISGNLAITSPAGSNAANSFDILNGGSLNFRTSVGGNAGLTSRLYITNDGYVGIGTTTPSEKLSVQQDAVGNLFGVRDGANSTSLLLADGGEATFKPTAFDYVYTFDGVSTYADNTTEAKTSGGTPFTVLSAEVSPDDYFYIGLDHKFATIYADVVTAGAGITLVGEYWNGSAWTALTITDSTTNLTTDGTITFTAPTDWATNAVNSQTKYWVRLSSSSSVTTAPTAYSVSPTTGNRFSVFAQNGDSTNPSLYVNDIGNVGIGTNAPATRLSIAGSTSSISNSSGDITIDAASGNISFNGDSLVNFSQALGSLGSDSAPTYSFNGDTNNGFYSPGADTLAWATDGVERMRLDSTGNLGIGTNNPDLPLSFAAATGGKINFYDGVNYDIGIQSSTFQFIIPTADASSRFVFGKGTTSALTEIMRIQNDGNVGIGDNSPAATLTVGSGDKFQVAGATGNITTAGDLALNGNDLTSTGAITITPNAGSNLNIALSSTGDLAVNTNHLYVDSSVGNVGIGTATPNSSYKLHVAGDLLVDTIYDTLSPGTWFINPGGASNLGGDVTVTGDYYMLDGSAMICGGSSADCNNPTVGVGTFNTVTIKGSDDGTTPSLCVEGTGEGGVCDGKINAGTIDPPYTINGKKYATYMASMTGVKEETVGSVRVNERVEGVGYRKVIDFNRQPDGSDLWLFSKTSRLRENIKDLIVLLTANENARTWFNIDKENLTLTIYSTKPTTVSYRLTAPRFDAEKWKNVREENDPFRGFLLTDQGDVYGQKPEEVSAAKLSNTNATYNGNLNEFRNQNQAFSVIGGYADEFISASSALIGKLKTGFVEAQNVIVNNVLVANRIVTDTLDITTANIKNFVVQEKISSPLVETNNLKVTETAKINKVETNEIKPQEEDLTLDLSQNNNPDSGKLAQLIIKGLEGKTVTTLDAQGNASFSGQVVADSLSIENDASVSGTLTANQLETNEASISGTLTAKEIQSDNLRDIENRLNRTASDSSTLASSINDIQKLLADIQNEPTVAPETQTNLSNTTDLSSMTLENLNVTGNTNAYNLSVSNSISTGNMLIEDNKILALSWDLNISALSTINFFDGAVTMTRNGTITTRGELIAEGGIRTDEIKPVSDDNVTIAKLAVDNLTINDKYLEATTSASVIAAADNFELNGLFAPAIETATSSAGVAILPSNSSEVVIYNDNITEDSLVYLTPTSDYPQSGQLTVVKKETEGRPYFKVSSNTVSALPVKFNWLIVK